MAQRGGGKLSMLPFEGITTDPATHKITLSDRAAFRADVSTNWDYYMIMGHGTCHPVAYRRVPENTYIMFSAPAGCRYWSEQIPYSNDTVAYTKNMFMVNVINNVERSINRINTIESETPLHSDPDFFLKTLAPSERRTLLECGTYPEEFKTLPVTKKMTNAACIASSKYTAKTIYGPGELYPETDMQFSNANTDTLLIMGAYQLPISPLLHSRMKQAYLRYKSYSDLSGNDDIKMHMADTLNKRLFTSEYGNLLEEKLGQTITLTQALSYLPPTDKKRFITVPTCRGICYLNETVAPVNRTETAMRARAASVNANANNARITESIDQATKYYSRMLKNNIPRDSRLHELLYGKQGILDYRFYNKATIYSLKEAITNATNELQLAQNTGNAARVARLTKNIEKLTQQMRFTQCYIHATQQIKLLTQLIERETGNTAKVTAMKRLRDLASAYIADYNAEAMLEEIIDSIEGTNSNSDKKRKELTAKRAAHVAAMEKYIRDIDFGSTGISAVEGVGAGAGAGAKGHAIR